MYINVAQLLKEPTGSTRNYQISETIGEKDIDQVEGKVIVVRTNQCILVSGSIDAKMKGTCSRCLNVVDYSVKFNFEEEFTPSIEIFSGLPLLHNVEGFKIDKKHNIDINEAIIQYAQLSIPMKLLCYPHCAGICQYCGHNLNEGFCTCATHI